ncbi:hypothetical protein [Curtobacterium sp. 9128]|uniref:hypothetical protein n=1 Tax=Curtobacterium sp. 9128 TaxID=1793722 RepID=UPI00119DD6BD|nr:hypothetical protein [Curtobacterium sp. 9128]
MNDAPGVLVVRLAVLGAVVLVLVGMLSCGPSRLCTVAAVVLGVVVVAATVVGAFARGRR